MGVGGIKEIDLCRYNLGGKFHHRNKEPSPVMMVLGLCDFCSLNL